jgi:hypothetical protein
MPEWATNTRIFVRLPTKYGEAYVDVDSISAVVPLADGHTIVNRGRNGEHVLTTASPDEVMASIHEAYVGARTAPA